MPDRQFTPHSPGIGIDGAHDFFNRRVSLGTPSAALATAIIALGALPASGTTTWTPSNPAGGILIGSNYGGHGASVTSPGGGTSDQGFVNDTYSGQSLWQLDVPRTLQYVSDTASEGATLTVSGLDRHGQFITEVVTLNGTTVVRGTKAFQYVISIAAGTRTQAGSKVSVGTDTRLGLQYRALDPDSEHRVYVSGVKGTNGTLDTVNGTYDPNAAPNGSRSYIVIYDSID